MTGSSSPLWILTCARPALHDMLRCLSSSSPAPTARLDSLVTASFPGKAKCGRSLNCRRLRRSQRASFHFPIYSEPPSRQVSNAM
ncbi:hypothetical protein BDW68DRAFT_150300 [Aspergillus falconensis]